jgi:hypothetical protein
MDWSYSLVVLLVCDQSALYCCTFDGRDAYVDVVRVQDFRCLIEELPPIELIALTMSLIQQLTKRHSEREEAKL